MSEGRLSTHVLDLTRGLPGTGILVEVYQLGGREGSGCSDDARRWLASARTNTDGRTDAPLLSGPDLTAGTFELVFHVGEYFEAKTEARFLDKVPIRFNVSDPNGRYHVPLLVTPWAYQTYRGS